MTPVRSAPCLLTLVISCAVPAVASAQSWLEAYQAGEYAKAANLLYEIVSQPDYVFRGDPGALRLLAEMYRDGQGVPRDPIGACSLAQDAEMATLMAPPARPIENMQDVEAYQGGQKQARDFAAAVCGALSGPDALTASRWRAGCYGFGMPEKTIAVGAKSVRVSRSGVGLAGAAGRDMTDLLDCPLAIAVVRIRTIDVPENAAPSIAPRHFVEIFAWRRNSAPGGADDRFRLAWQMFEIQSKEVMPMLPETILAASSILQDLPPGFDARVTVQMIRSGHVLWRIEGAPPKRRWLMLPDSKGSR